MLEACRHKRSPRHFVLRLYRADGLLMDVSIHAHPVFTASDAVQTSSGSAPIPIPANGTSEAVQVSSSAGSQPYLVASPDKSLSSSLISEDGFSPGSIKERPKSVRGKSGSISSAIDESNEKVNKGPRVAYLVVHFSAI